ncbi:hypothetical protein B9Q32_07370, partial [Enterobacter kobei]|uniref:hypothetical protein n=1 Tax=Enterobacter kobei TaxID=208224 RepID=UPI000CC517AD
IWRVLHFGVEFAVPNQGFMALMALVLPGRRKLDQVLYAGMTQRAGSKYLQEHPGIFLSGTLAHLL